MLRSCRRAVLVALVLETGCLSPTLPLPPPEAPLTITESVPPGEDGESTWLVRGTCSPGAIVLVENVDTGRIQGIEDDDGDGRYTLSVAAKPCARAEVWQLFEDIQSTRTGFLVAPTTNGSVAPGACVTP
ncbi:MAG: hypothetical protein FJ096_19095 [Deltaproteobacteria bacterium]|nr:hypothetical protein [Deltaproteobacteria bacterium]